jgi:hypothetical protein
MTARTRQRFGDRPFQIHRRITEGEHENSFEGVTVGSSDDESLHQKPKKRSKPSLTQLASEVAGSQELIDDEIRLTSFQARSSSLPKRHTCGVIPSGSGNNDPLMQDHSVATSSGGEERKGKVRRPSQLSLHSDEVFEGESHAKSCPADQSGTPATPMISITRCFSGDTDPSDDCDPSTGETGLA